MFFTIQHTHDLRFPLHTSLNDGRIMSHDSGWEVALTDHGMIVFKGYIEGVKDFNKIAADPTPRSYGNFTCIISRGTETIVTHERNRSVPLFYDRENDILTNLPKNPTSMEPVYADRYVTLKDNDIIDTFFRPFDDVFGEITLDQALHQIEDLLRYKAQEFKKIGDPLNVYFTGGVDTGLLIALLNAEEIDYKLVDCEHVEYDSFTCKNLQTIRKRHWAYKQIHHWKESTWLASGAPGDEFLMRSPETLAIWAAWNDIDIINEIGAAILFEETSFYHSKYFLKPDNRAIFERMTFKEAREKWPKREDMFAHILDRNVNDHQHWHLGNTLTWTPFRDIRLTEILLQLPVDVLMSQALDAHITKELVRRLDSDVLPYISPDKNFDNMAKICELFQ